VAGPFNNTAKGIVLVAVGPERRVNASKILDPSKTIYKHRKSVWDWFLAMRGTSYHLKHPRSDITRTRLRNSAFCSC
jgi:hypothetical protein